MSALKYYRYLTPLISSEEINEINKIEEKRSLAELIDFHDKIILLGEPGAGKSFELENLFKKIWSNKENSQLYPFLITLKKYHHSCTFEDLIPNEDWSKLPNIVFILDGLDETAYPHDFISVLEVFINKHRQRNLKFVISSRTNIYLNHQLKLESFKPFKLEPLDIDQINNIILQEEVDNVVLNQEFIDKHPFYTNPFFLVALIKFFKEKDKWLDTESDIWEYYVENELNLYQSKQIKKRNVVIPAEKKRLKQVSLINELQGKVQIDEDNLFRILGETFSEFIDNPFVQKQDNVYSFTHRQYQEYFTALVLKELSFEELKKVVLIEGLNKVRPGLINIISLMLSLTQEGLFKKLSTLLIEKDVEILIKSDTLRITIDSKFSIFKDYFNRQCVEKKLWIGTNSAISDKDLAQFADSQESFMFLIDIIKNKDHNHRARISAINLIEEFKSIDEGELIKTIEYILDSGVNLSFKSTTIRLINSLRLDKRVAFLRKIIDQYPEESNKEWNRSLIAILAELDNIDDFFDYLQREFNWANKIIPRNESDDVHRGNSWLMTDLILRLNIESNFLELATFYFDDYNLRTNEPFRKNLIEKCLDFERKFSGFIVKLLEKIQKREKTRSYQNKEILTELIKRSNKELDAFKIMYNEVYPIDIDSSILAKITTEETIDYFVGILEPKDAIKVRLQAYRNMIAYHGERDLAIYLETKLIEKGIDIENKIPTEAEEKKIQNQLAKEVQENADLLFKNESLIQKIISAIAETGSGIINSQIVRKLERSYYDVKENWFRALGCEFDILFAATHLYHTLTIDDITEKLKNSKRIQIIALKGMLESNKGAQFKFEISVDHKDTIKQWLQKESNDFDFENIIRFDSFNGFTPIRVEDYKFLKSFYYYLDLNDFQESFGQEFLINSIIYYKIEEFEPFSEHFDNLVNRIEDKEALKNSVITNIKAKIFTFPMERMIVYALNNKISEVYPEIFEFLEISTHSPGDKLFDLYFEKNPEKAKELIEKISLDLSTYKGWSALKELSNFADKHVYCITRCLNYLQSGQAEYKSNAMRILFKLNHPSACLYFIEGIGENPLSNIPHKYRADYFVTSEILMENFEKLFMPIYQTNETKDQFDRDWEFSDNNTFFTQLITNVLRLSLNKVETYEQLKQKLKDVQENSTDDRIIFFANSIIEILKNNYISLMSEPMSFDEALKLSKQIVSNLN